MSSVVVVPGRGRLLVAGLWAVWLVGLLVFVASTVVVGRDERDVLLDTWLYSALAVGAAVLALLRPVLVRRGRALWTVGALALVLYAAGDVLYSTVVVRQEPEPYPSVADGLWLSYYVLAVVLLVGLLRTRARGASASTAVDGVVVGLGAAAATAAVSFDTIRRAAGGTALETAATLGYPVGALVLLGTAGAALAVMGWRVGLQWWALVLGGLVFAGADTAYAYLSATTGYSDGSPLDAAWLLALGLQAAAAWLAPRRARHALAGSVATLVLPLGFAVAALALLVLEHFQRLSLLALVLAAATVAAALLRITLTVSEVRQLAATREQALTDELTGLPNRRRLDQALRAALAEGPVGLLMLDLDRFKDVNDALGHPAGDQLLRQVARRLDASMGEGETAGRLGGDEFAVVLPGTGGPALLDRARRVAALLDPPVDLGHISIDVSTSVGAASVPDHAQDASSLMRAADVAMYRAKRRGTGVALYRASSDTASPQHREVVDEFRDTFAAAGVACTYVPVLGLRDGRLRRVRAVPRWEHPRLGAVPSRELLEMVERTGMVRELTTGVLDRALADRAAWAAAGHEVVLAVHVSAVELLDARLPRTVTDALRRHGVPASCLVVECSAEALAAEPERSRRALQALVDAGVGTGATGHGAGRSSSTYLHDVRVGALTLDSTLSRVAGRDAAATAVVEAAVVLAHGLGLPVHATDVADAGVLRHLGSLGVDAADGPAVAEPLEHAQVLQGRLGRPAA